MNLFSRKPIKKFPFLHTNRHIVFERMIIVPIYIRRHVTFDTISLSCWNFDTIFSFSKIHFFLIPDNFKLGGKLFANLDGTRKQLDFFFEKLQNESHWLGVYTTNHSVWLDTEGHKVDNAFLHWDPAQGFNFENKQYHVCNYKRDQFKYLNDMNENWRFYSICDML